MGQPTSPSPVLLLLAAFSRYDEAIAWGRDRAVAAWGPLAMESPPFGFDHTHYYDASMGPGLRKVFFGFARPADPAGLAEWKLAANSWEEQYAALARHPEPRPLNLDPGYVALSKLVLASTKDFAHRLYLGRGIYGEVTLLYQKKDFRALPWTYPDYQSKSYLQYFRELRKVYMAQLASSGSVSGDRDYYAK